MIWQAPVLEELLGAGMFPDRLRVMDVAAIFWHCQGVLDANYAEAGPFAREVGIMEVGNTTQEQRRAREEDQAQQASLETAGSRHQHAQTVGGNRNAPAPVTSTATVQRVSPDQYATYRQEGSAAALKMQIYARDNDSQTHQFESREAANAFAWDEYKKMHPDASEQAHVDSGWDAFKRGFADTVSNPVGQTVSQIGKWAGSSPETQKELYKAGGNPLGFTGKELAGAAGASDAVQDKVAQVGKTAESAAPVWGQARLYGGAVADAAKGKPPTLELTQSVTQDAKSGAGITPIVGAAAGAKAVSAAPSPAVEVSPNAGEQRRAPPKSVGTPGFNPPQRLEDGRIGYPLSPTSPPKLPGATSSSSQTDRTEASLAGAGTRRFVEDGQQPSTSTSAGARTASGGSFLAPIAPAERRFRNGPLTEAAQQRVADYVLEHQIADHKVAQIFQISETTVQRVREKFGLEKESGRGVPLAAEKKAAVAKTFTEAPDTPPLDVARQHGIRLAMAYAIRKEVRDGMRTASGEAAVVRGLDLDKPLDAREQQKLEEIRKTLDQQPQSSQVERGASGSQALTQVRRRTFEHLSEAERQKVDEHIRKNPDQLAKDAAHTLNLSTSSIRKYRNELGLPVATTRFTQAQKDTIAAEIGGNLQVNDTDVAARHGASPTLVGKIRRAYGLPTKAEAIERDITRATPRTPAPKEMLPQNVKLASAPVRTTPSSAPATPAQSAPQSAPQSPSAMSEIMELDELRDFNRPAPAKQARIEPAAESSTHPSGVSPVEPPPSSARAPEYSASNEEVITWMQSNVEHALIDQILGLPQADFSAHIGYYRELMELERQT